MAFSSSNRTDVAGIIPEEYSNDFLAATVASSAVLSNFRTIPLGTKITRMPVLSALPSAGWVNEYPTAGHQAPTSKATWGACPGSVALSMRSTHDKVLGLASGV